MQYIQHCGAKHHQSFGRRLKRLVLVVVDACRQRERYYMNKKLLVPHHVRCCGVEKLVVHDLKYLTQLLSSTSVRSSLQFNTCTFRVL